MEINLKFEMGQKVFVVVEAPGQDYRFNIKCKLCEGNKTLSAGSVVKDCPDCEGKGYKENGYFRVNRYQVFETIVTDMDVSIYNNSKYQTTIMTGYKDYVDWSDYKEQIKYSESEVYATREEAEKKVEALHRLEDINKRKEFKKQGGVD